MATLVLYLLRYILCRNYCLMSLVLAVQLGNDCTYYVKKVNKWT